MPVERQFNTFIKGLITEASPLTFPENASIAEDNFVLNTDGTRSRRLGIDYEIGYVLKNTGLSPAVLKQSRVSFHRWDTPGGDPNLSIGIIRVGPNLWFIDLLKDSPSSSFLNEGLPMPLLGLGQLSEVEMSLVNNYLVVVSRDLDSPIILSYDQISGEIFQEESPLQVRDIWGVDDGLSDSERPSTLSSTHHYNLLNQGWNTNIQVAGLTTIVVGNPIPPPTKTTGLSTSSLLLGALSNPLVDKANRLQSTLRTTTKTVPNTATAIQDTKDKLGVYPSNSDTWILGKTSDPNKADFQKYDPNILLKNSLSNVLAPRAGLIISAYDRGTSRRNSTGLQTLLLDKELGRVSTIAPYSSRLFYSGVHSQLQGDDSKSPNYNSYIFFSQIVTSKDKVKACYQVADPTSPDISDIVDTDGGTIQLPEATNIVKLIPSLGSLLVISENGVWEIYGDTGGFKATSFQASKVSSSGITNPNTVIEVNGTVVGWGNSGILLFTSDQVSGRFKAENISLTTIQTLYNSISDLARRNAKVLYDERENTIRWLYNDLPTYSVATGLSSYNRELILDLNLKAFYLSSIHSSTSTNIPYISNYVNMPSFTTSISEDKVVVFEGDVLVDDDPVTIISLDFSGDTSQFKFLTLVDSSFTLSSYRDETFRDWKSSNGIGYNYESYLITGYDIAQDLMRQKRVPYIFTYLTRTETGFGVDLLPIKPSSCFLQAQWNWNNSPAGGKWGTPFQTYRLPRHYTPSGVFDAFDTGEKVLVTKSKLRGSGKSISLKFSSEEGKDIKLLGWAYPFGGDTSV